MHRFSSLQLIYQNLHQDISEVEVCEEPKCCDCPCDQSCDHEEEEQTLINTNNYQFCWKPISSFQPASGQSGRRRGVTHHRWTDCRQSPL